MLECAAIHSVANHTAFQPAAWRQRPYRAPHHTASTAALVGGGSNPKPGEISLAHRGVLFLNELPEFDSHTLELLREPLENGHITISRANHQVYYPSRFQIIATMNPRPCATRGTAAIAATAPSIESTATACAFRVSYWIATTCMWRCRNSLYS